MASSILKWVVSQQSYSGGKPSIEGEACEPGSGSKKGVWGPRLHRARRAVPGGAVGPRVQGGVVPHPAEEGDREWLSCVV